MTVAMVAGTYRDKNDKNKLNLGFKFMHYEGDKEIDSLKRFFKQDVCNGRPCKIKDEHILIINDKDILVDFAESAESAASAESAPKKKLDEKKLEKIGRSYVLKIKNDFNGLMEKGKITAALAYGDGNLGKVGGEISEEGGLFSLFEDNFIHQTLSNLNKVEVYVCSATPGIVNAAIGAYEKKQAKRHSERSKQQHEAEAGSSAFTPNSSLEPRARSASSPSPSFFSPLPTPQPPSPLLLAAAAASEQQPDAKLDLSIFTTPLSSSSSSSSSSSFFSSDLTPSFSQRGLSPLALSSLVSPGGSSLVSSDSSLASFGSSPFPSPLGSEGLEEGLFPPPYEISHTKSTPALPASDADSPSPSPSYKIFFVVKGKKFAPLCELDVNLFPESPDQLHAPEDKPHQDDVNNEGRERGNSFS